ncbi:hypothetical protein L2E82_00953 [Cichorium intybus]|uniref:Uncharacterized protein n=1 Tax=Cichorium intybus TaxID=13427 RepID=A0ACB9GXM7_CICIN|nr:hypothetical protein L2E82_00953 [Cichorium intybus]
MVCPRGNQEELDSLQSGFDNCNTTDFNQRSQNDLDPTLLEFGWIELLETNNVAPVESYCAHLLLSRDEIYFTVLDSKGSSSVYGPRPTVQVEEMKRRILAKEAADKEFNEFLELLKSAKAMPPRGKPSKSSWKLEEKIWYRIEFLEAFAIYASKDDAQRNTAGAVIAKWRPEEAWMPDLIDALVFYPTEKEFEDTLKYISSIREKVEAYGICRIVPPSSWKPPCPL